MRLIVFDMDGTLIDTQALISEHVAMTFANAGIAAPDASEARQVIGLSLPIALGRLARSDDSVLIDGLVEQYKANYLNSIVTQDRAEPLYPGAMAALDRLKTIESNRLGIATGKELPAVDRILARHGIDGHFVTLQTPDHNPSKPHPGMLLRAMDETGIAARDTVMIGDTTYDILLAKAAGTKAIGVSWGYHDRADLLAAGADILIDRYEDLDAAIEQVLADA